MAEGSGEEWELAPGDRRRGGPLHDDMAQGRGAKGLATPPRLPLVAALGVVCCEVLPALNLRLTLVPSRHEAVRRVDDLPVPVLTLLSRPRPYIAQSLL